jgi:hypothetical protein
MCLPTVSVRGVAASLFHSVGGCEGVGGRRRVFVIVQVAVGLR